MALTLATGTLLGLGQLLSEQPERDDAEAADRLAADLLRVYGVPADEAQEICRRPLPDLDVLTGSAPAEKTAQTATAFVASGDNRNVGG